jgi:hypothetical protein
MCTTTTWDTDSQLQEVDRFCCVIEDWMLHEVAAWRDSQVHLQEQLQELVES